MYICIYVHTYLLIHTYVQKETYKYEPAHIGGARLRPEREKTSRKLTLILLAQDNHATSLIINSGHLLVFPKSCVCVF